MTVLQSTHRLYCSHCFASKRIFLSTTEQEKQSFRNYHDQCISAKDAVKESYPFQLRDWKDRTGEKI